jgi:hypothetical protein
MTGRIKFAAVLAVAAAMVGIVVATAGAAGSSPAASKPAARSAASKAAARRGALLRHANFKTVAGAAAYFRAIGVDPRGLVIQRAARNYAGPNCPGAGWACISTAHPVVQIARAGGSNRFLCTSGRCAVVQLAARGSARSGRSLTASAPTKPNTAGCVKTTGLGQTCSISQSSATVDNQAIVYEDAAKMTGLTQTASYMASITQQATGFKSPGVPNSNFACVHQVISMTGSTNTSGKKGVGANVALEAHQSVTINQDVTTGGADNANQSASLNNGSATCNPVDTAGLVQSQTLTSTVSASGPIVQNENAANGGPNVSIDIEQNQGIGHGAASAGNVTFTQTNSLTAIAGTTSGSVSQTQSSQASGSILAGGILGTVNQNSTGVLTANANQTETQCEDAVNTAVPSGFTCDNGASGEIPPTPSSLTQTQYGPIGTTAGPGPKGERRLAKTGKDGSRQTGGNSADTFTIVQHSTQQNDNPDQTQPNITQADCATSGNCTANQTVTDGNTTSQNTTTGPTVDTTVNCAATCTTTTTNGTNRQGLIVGNTAAFGNGPIKTYDLATGALVNSFVPDGATASPNANGRGVAVVGGEIFYTELSDGCCVSDGIHVAPFNNGAGGHDLRVLPNPASTRGIQDLTFAGGALYALTGYGSSGPLQVWKLDATTGAVIAGPITISGPRPNADGFAILPDGNFLINAGDGSCTYTEYNSAGQATANSFTVPNGSICTGVETDGSFLYFQTNFNSFTKTDLTGKFISTTSVASNDEVEDVALG